MFRHHIVQMICRVNKAELLDAMKESLYDLESMEILGPDDIEILGLRRTLHQQIARLEKESSEDYKIVVN
jgi:hypothetical protein